MQISSAEKTLPDPVNRDDGPISRGTVASLALHAAKWNYLGVILRVVIQLIAQIILARFLGPAEFGFYALCFMVVGVGYLIAEMGLSSALIQSRSLTSSDIQRVWTLLLVSGLLGAGLLVATAEQLALLLGNPEAVGYLRFAALPLFLQVIASVALALLRKSLDFKRIQLAQLTGMIVGHVFVGFTLAMILHTAWAMLWAWFVQLLVSWMLMFTKVRHRLIPAWPRGISHLSWFGARAFTTNIANWLIENFDNLLVARFFGARSLGFYTVSYNLVRYPTNHLVTTLQSVLFPTSAAIQNDHVALRTAYLAALSLVAIVTVPLFIAAAIFAEPLILILYGREWREAIAIMQPLALAMPLHALTAVSGPLLWGMNRVGTESLLQWITVLSFLVLVIALGLVTPVQLAWMVFVVYLMRAFLLVLAVMHILDLQLDDLIGCFTGSLILGCVAAGSAELAIAVAKVYYPLIQVGVAIAIAGLLSFALFWLVPNWVLAPGLARVLRRFSGHLPQFVVSRLEAVTSENEHRINRNDE